MAEQCIAKRRPDPFLHSGVQYMLDSSISKIILSHDHDFIDRCGTKIDMQPLVQAISAFLKENQTDCQAICEEHSSITKVFLFISDK
jgi:hypothetical protein